MDNILISLTLLPNHWPTINTKEYGSVHKAILNGRTLIFYKVYPHVIYVVDIRDARSNWK